VLAEQSHEIPYERTPSERRQRDSRWATLRRVLDRTNFLVIPLIVFVVALSLLTDTFLTSQNLFNIMRAAAVYIIIGVGQTLVITSANIDLSVGSMLALVMALTGTYLVVYEGSLPVAILLALTLGGIFGLFNGLVVTRLHVPALLATLGTLVTYRGVVHEFMGHRYYTRLPEGIVYLGQGMVGPVPVPVIIALVVATVGVLIYHYTRFGRYAVAIGGNEEAAVLAGINVRLWKTLIFVFQGLLVGLAAVVMMGRLNAAHPSVGQGAELHVIAGTVLGGTLLFGGSGTIVGMVLGMLLIGVLENGLLLARLGFFWQQIFLGLLIIFAVAVQIARQGRLVRR
jgi:ribose/xylose/arabinose/galactoside ABC-type transport system permease subunit